MIDNSSVAMDFKLRSVDVDFYRLRRRRLQTKFGVQSRCWKRLQRKFGNNTAASEISAKVPDSHDFTRRLLMLFPMATLIYPARTSAEEISQGNSLLRGLGIGDPDIYYPSLFEGLWDCFSTLIDIETPQGEDKADKKNLDFARKRLGYTVNYQARFVPYKGNIIGDRLFTTVSLLEATMGKDVVKQKLWDPEHANRLSLVLSGGTKVENLVTKRSFRMSGPGQFDVSEYSKQVFDRFSQSGPPSTSIKASRNITRYKWGLDESPVTEMEALQRVSMYPVPGEKLENLDIFGMDKPITIYKYIIRFKRASEAA